MSDVPAGWFPDPSGAPGLLRYWDGAAWTNHVHQQTAPAPYASYGSTPAAAVATTPDGEPLAGWWHRVGAAVLDGIFSAIVTIPLTLPAQISMQRHMNRLQDELQRRVDAGTPGTMSWFFHQMADTYRSHLGAILLPIVVTLIGFAAFLVFKGGTPGQLLTGLRVRLRERPGNLTWGAALLRVALYSTLGSLATIGGLMTGSLALDAFLLLAGVLWSLLNPLWAAWDPKRQALHDKIVGTNVVRVRR